MVIVNSLIAFASLFAPNYVIKLRINQFIVVVPSAGMINLYNWLMEMRDIGYVDAYLVPNIVNISEGRK